MFYVFSLPTTVYVGTLKSIVILLFKCIVGKCFVVFYVFSLPTTVYVGTLNLIASIPGPSILTFNIIDCRANDVFLAITCPQSIF